MDPRHQLKRNQRDSQTWERGEDGTWQPSQPADRSSPPPAGVAGTSGYGAFKGGRRSVDEEFADAALQLEQNE